MTPTTLRRLSARIGHRRVVAAVCALILLAPLATGLTAAGLSLPVAGAFAGVVLVLLAWGGARWLPAAWDTAPPTTWLVAMLLTFLVVTRVSVYMYDPSRVEWSVLPASELRAHSCLTALTGALERLAAGTDIYAEPGSAARVAGRFDTDPYFYAPSFLWLPVAVSFIVQTQDFLELRGAWFAFQVLSLMAAVLVMAVFIGGRFGRGVVLALPVLWLAPPVLMNLQIGNFQISAVALAAAGAALTAGGSMVLGAALLATAVTSKLFPGVLLVYLAVAGRIRAVVWTAAWGVGFALLFLLVFGVQPFRDYLTALPGIQDGTVGITAMLTQNAPDNVANHSYFGLTRKLVALGLPIPPAVERAFQTLAGLLVLAVAAWAAWRRRGAETSEDRWREVLVWVALLNLASFRSPFVPDLYAYPGMYLLVALLVGGLSRLTWRGALVLGLAWLLMAPLDALLTLAFLPGPTALILTLGVQVAVIAVNLACALDRRFPDRVQRWLVGPSTV